MTKKAAVQGAATFQKYVTEFCNSPKSSKFCGDQLCVRVCSCGGPAYHSEV